MEMVLLIVLLPTIFVFAIAFGMAIEEAKTPLVYINTKKKDKKSEDMINLMTLQERGQAIQEITNMQ